MHRAATSVTPQRVIVSGLLASLVIQSEKTSQLAMPDDDEISQHEAWLPDTNPELVDPLSLINISGTPELQELIRLLCIEYKDIFSNSFSAEPASIPPFDLVVQDPKWRVSKNRQAPRPQSAANQKEISRQLNIFIDQSIIEKSTAAYYSQGFLVTKADGSKRFVIDYCSLKECTEHASWPLPNITQNVTENQFSETDNLWHGEFCSSTPSSRINTRY